MLETLLPFLLCLISGILYALGFPSFLGESLLITPIIAAIILFYFFLTTHNFKRQILYGLAFCLGFNYMGFYWITATLQEFGELPMILATLMASAFTFVVMPHLWIILISLYFLNKKLDLAKDFSATHSFLFAIAMALFEYYTPQQFPTHIGQPWMVFGKYLGLASIFGLPMFSFISYLTVFEVIRFKMVRSYSKLSIVIVLLFIIVNPLLAIKNINNDSIYIRFAQANIGNYLKVESESGDYNSVSEVLSYYNMLSTKPPQYNKNIDLIIWPETAYPYSVESKKLKESSVFLPGVFTNIINQTKAEILSGGYDHNMLAKNDFYESEYNSAFLFGQDKLLKNVYHKQKLIPFGETLPLGIFNEWMSSKVSGVSFFATGNHFTIFNTKDNYRFITPICYEILNPEFIRDYLNSTDNQPNFMINLTNDSWYGDTAEPRQHLFLAKWRALEFNMPIVRSTNTGITSVVYPDGTESERLLTGERNNLDVDMNFNAQNTKTPYQIMGIFNSLILWLVLSFAYWIRAKKRRKSD